VAETKVPAGHDAHESAAPPKLYVLTGQAEHVPAPAL
jgi:hypothetical protein